MTFELYVTFDLLQKLLTQRICIMAEASQGETWKEWLWAGKDMPLLEGMSWFLLSLCVLLILLQFLKIEAPYGRYRNNKGLLSYFLLTNVRVPARLAWFCMEMPSFIIPLYLVLNVGGNHIGKVNPNIVLLGMYILHYFNRY